MALSREETQHIADLARLALTDEELDRYASQLSSILEYAARLDAIAIEGIPPTATVLPIHSVTRADVVKEGLGREEVIGLSADSEDGMFRVRAAIGGADE